MKDLHELLAGQPLFEGIEPDHIEFLVRCCKLVHCRPGETVFAEGDEADQCFVVRTGMVIEGLHLPDRGEVGLATVEPGELLGWSWLIPPHRWSLDARAGSETSLFAFDAKCLREKLDGDPQLGYVLMSRLAQVAGERLLMARHQLVDFYGTRGHRA